MILPTKLLRINKPVLAANAEFLKSSNGWMVGRVKKLSPFGPWPAPKTIRNKGLGPNLLFPKIGNLLYVCAARKGTVCTGRMS